jgi:hypothetical protein
VSIISLLKDLDCGPMPRTWEDALDVGTRLGLSHDEVPSLFYETGRGPRKKDFPTDLLNAVRRYRNMTRPNKRQRMRHKEYERYKLGELAEMTRNELLHDWVRRAVEDLPDPDKRLIKAIYWGDVSIRELARTWGVDNCKLKRQHRRILRGLRKRINNAFGLRKAA